MGSRHGWPAVSEMQQTIVLPGVVREAIIAHAREEAPRECCGVLVGLPGAMTVAPSSVRVLRLTNVAPGRDRYEIAPDEVFHVVQAAERDDQEIVGIYHSHPIGPAHPSRTDIALAFWPGAVSLICGLEGDAAPLVRAFTIVDGLVMEHAVAIR